MVMLKQRGVDDTPDASRSWSDRIRTGRCEFRRPVRYSEVED
jgi:hypothetical protein